jgi:phenylpropionate dioxygenase-like ring-hydroxylating dioxygenase large terminal subunit
MDARCAHMGADLGRGKVVGESLECAYHRWRYGLDGRCERIPCISPSPIPSFAQQEVYPAEIYNDLVFVFHGARALYPLPFFDGRAPQDFVCSEPFVIELECPWYMIGANAFDFQHLYSVHERQLLETPAVQTRGPFARVARTVSRVGHLGWYDGFVRRICGDTAEMTVTDWSGCLIFVRVRLRRAVTYGMVSVRPLSENRVRVYIFAFLENSRTEIARTLVDPLRTRVRRLFIEQFVRADAERLSGIRKGPLNLIAADEELSKYFEWLTHAANGIPGVPG